MVSIEWTELSINDIKEIFDFIAEDSHRYAAITAAKIYQRIQPVSTNPLLGKVVPEFGNKLIREVLEGNYRIIYRIKSKTQIDVLRVYHSARLLRKKAIR